MTKAEITSHLIVQTHVHIELAKRYLRAYRAFSALYPEPPKKHFSLKARRAISRAQKLRWARLRRAA